MKVKAANGLARILKAEGVPWVSTFPTCGVNNSLGEEKVPIVMMREERFAAAIADGFSRVTGGKNIGVFTVMGGVNAAGLQMAYGAIAQAFEDSSPLLCLTDGIPVGGSGNTHYDINLGLHAVTKWIGNIDQAHRVPEIMRRAFTNLRTGRPGPVLVTVPRGLGEYDEDEFPYTPVKGWKSGPDPDDVKAAVKALLAAKNPLLYVGEGVFYADATAELLKFAEMAQVPVLTTLKAKSAFPENNPLSVGVRGELAANYLRKCDLLFAIGSSLSPGRFSHAIPDAKDKTIVQCTVDTLDINKSYETDYAVIGDAKLTLQALISELASQTGGGVKKNQALLDEIKAVREQFMAKYRPLLESNDKPINPYRVYGDLMKTIDLNNSFVSPDSGNTRDQTSTIYEAVIPHGFLGWGNVSTLGFGLAAAAAAKLAYPERQCVNVSGDAGVGYMLGNFESLVRNKIGITTIHINNGGFAGYGPGFWGGGHDPYTCVVSDYTVAKMAQAVGNLGEYAERIEEPSDIIPALKRAFTENEAGRPAYLEFICSQYPVHGGWVTAGAVPH
ncbi:MAG: thiamine pyrophosphate-binding protein [Bacteroidetes bacterium]|nr:thiamine pyrophosphate-binding protein [Bacteroidota bacterium]MCL5025017.1 thiamine pyrophosphate-binding protein [Chloroflexota bacterium]